MPQQTDSAKRTSVRRLIDGRIAEGMKVRVAGRVQVYDAETGVIVLADRTHGVLVDVTLCLDEAAHAWATERLSTVMVVGHLERCKISLAVPKGVVVVVVDGRRVLRAILVVDAPGLDLGLWNTVVDEEDEGGGCVTMVGRPHGAT